MAPLDAAQLPSEPLDDLYEHAPCGQLSSLVDGTVVRLNATLLQWSGYLANDVVGRRFVDLLTVGSRLFYDTRCLPVLQLQGEVREVALELRCADGSTLPILINSVLRSPRDGGPDQIWTAVFDATTRQDYERALLGARRAAEQSEARVRVLQQASEAFAAARTEAAVTGSLADVTRSAFDASTATVLLLQTGRTELVSATPLAGPLGEAVSVDSWRPEAVALRSGEVVTIASVDDAERRFPDLAHPLHQARQEALIATPLLGDDGPLGVLVCLFGRRRDFPDHETELHRTLARQATQALQRVRLQAQLQHLAHHDGLTGLANRALLQSRLDVLLAPSDELARSVALIFLDLDGFKAINDQLGHVTGDSVLEQVAERLLAVVRRGDTVARFGGDEFVIMCDDATPADAERVAERVQATVREPLTGVPPDLPLTASIGVALHRREVSAEVSVSPDQLVLAADGAMYQSKRDGKDRRTVVRL